ncbi:hypothetical protein SNEBB_002524 [Seison nebaliae]|nr:hypothetical protein SNEBB_002524 [Seison nebaliae]
MLRLSNSILKQTVRLPNLYYCGERWKSFQRDRYWYEKMNYANVDYVTTQERKDLKFLFDPILVSETVPPPPKQTEVLDIILDVCKKYRPKYQYHITENSNFVKDLKLDSLDYIELIVHIEDEFGFEFSDLDYPQLQTPVQVQRYVCEKYNLKD